MGKKVQISMDLFMKLLRFHLLKESNVDEIEIQQALEKKMNAMIRHEKYTKYKTAEDPVKKEDARLAYLDFVGIGEGFRW